MIMQDLLNRTQAKQPLNWYKTLKSYYYRDEWELYDLKHDAEEVKNVAYEPVYKVSLI
jgi:N-sulfoglucosamine sulfohydrolase